MHVVLGRCAQHCRQTTVNTAWRSTQPHTLILSTLTATKHVMLSVLAVSLQLFLHASAHCYSCKHCANAGVCIIVLYETTTEILVGHLDLVH
jgi:hypothetical protein